MIDHSIADRVDEHPIESDAPPAPFPIALSEEDRRRVLRSSASGAIVGAVPFMLVLWDFGLKPLRRAAGHGFASNFYEIQARALFHGHLSVPDGILGVEGFVVRGHTYMYFPPFPAIVRMPILLVTDRLDGRLTTVSMMTAWLVLAVATPALLWRIRLLLRGGEPVSRLELWTSGLFVAGVTGGSVLLYIAAVPWVYHEVYLWSAALAIATMALVLAVVEHPSHMRVALCGACSVATILTRTTSGWAIAFMVLAIAALLTWQSRPSDRAGVRELRRAARSLTIVAVLTLAVGSFVNWLKFRHPYMFPLEHQVWTQENGHRRLALAFNSGSLNGPQFLLTSAVNYLRPDGVRLVPYFPFVTLPATPARSYGGAFVDQTYRTGSVPAFMPLLALLTAWGFVTVFRRGAANVGSLRILTLGALAVTTGVMAYGYVAFRYVAEFVPVLVVAGAIGLIDVARRAERRSRYARRSLVVVIAALALFGTIANGAAGIAAARSVARGESLRQYVEMQARVSALTGHRLDRVVEQSGELPTTGPADELHILGECDALYLATGDQYEPWVTVEVRDLVVVITAAPDGVRPATVPLIRITGARSLRVTLETSDDDSYRLRIGEGFYYLPTAWYSLSEGASITVRLRADTARNRFVLTASNGLTTYVPAAEWNGQWRFVVGMPRLEAPDVAAQERAGVSLNPESGPPLALCNRLLDRID